MSLQKVLPPPFNKIHLAIVAAYLTLNISSAYALTGGHVSIDTDKNALHLTNTVNTNTGGLLYTDPDNNNFYTDSEDNSKKGVASSFDQIIIELDPNLASGTMRGNDPFSFRLDAPNTDLQISVKQSDKENFDAFHLSNHFPHLVIRDFSATVDARNSDAINISHDCTTDAYVQIQGDLTAEVSQGNGIRANASRNGSENQTFVSSIDVYGTTDITITGSNVRNSVSFLTITYDPAAIYAGNSLYYFNFIGWHGAESFGKGEISLHGDTILTLKGDKNYGVLGGKNGSVTLNNLYIEATGDKAIGVAADNKNLTMGSFDQSTNRHGSFVFLNGDENVIHMLGDESKALFANSEYAKISSGNNGIGSIDLIGDVEANDNGSIDLTIRNDAKVIGQIKSTNSGKISFNASGAINFSAPVSTTESSQLVLVAGTDKWKAEDVDFENPFDTNVIDVKFGKNSNDERSYVTGDIVSGFGGIIDIAPNATVRSTDNGLSVVGNVLAGNGGKISLSLGDGAYFEGRTDDYQDAEWNHDIIASQFVNRIQASGTIDLHLGHNSTWKVTGQSWLSSFEADNSTIDLTQNNTSIHLGSITGQNNTFIVNLSMDGSGNMIYVKDGTAENQNIFIKNRDEVLSSMKTGDRVRFATIANAGGGFQEAGSNQTTTFGKTVSIDDAGIKKVDFEVVYEDYDKSATEENDKYNNAQGDGSAIEIDKPGSDYVETIYDANDTAQNAYLVRLKEQEGEDEKPEEVLSDAGRTIVNISRANYTNAVQLDTLNKRQGEMQFSQGRDDGLWVRMRHDEIGKKGAFRLNNNMIELGVDSRYVKDNGEFHTGIALDYMDGSTDFHDVNGQGDLDRYGIWFYTTWLGNEGYYSDLIFKFGHLENQFDIITPSVGERVKGDYSNDVFLVSLEQGKKFRSEESWFIEPQAQLQYAYVTSDEYTTSQDSYVRLDGIHSLIGRLGVRAGKDFGADNLFSVYARSDLMHEFLGDQDIYAKDKTGALNMRYENDDTWYSAGVGMTYTPNEDSVLFFEAESVFGASNKDSYIFSGGVRILFN